MLATTVAAAAHSKPHEHKRHWDSTHYMHKAIYPKTIWHLFRSPFLCITKHPFCQMFCESSKWATVVRMYECIYIYIYTLSTPSGMHTFVETISIKIFVDRLWTENNLKEGLIVKLDLRSSNDNGCCHTSATIMWTMVVLKKTGSGTFGNSQRQWSTTFSHRSFNTRDISTLSFTLRIVSMGDATLWVILWFELKHYQLMISRNVRKFPSVCVLCVIAVRFTTETMSSQVNWIRRLFMQTSTN